ncbi:MAG: DoxX family protein [Prevotella sp.]|nr:DoxX family protein [Prevotella sp.]
MANKEAERNNGECLSAGTPQGVTTGKTRDAADSETGKKTVNKGNHTSSLFTPHSVLKRVIDFCRLLLGLTFTLSGFVKAIDPQGTQYKIEDYLEAWGLQAYAADLLTLGASVALSAVEFWLGVCMLFAIRRRRTSRLMLVVMSVMTPLTLWLALTDPISDCGCFGDAVTLTNWQTFWKNVVLLLAAVAVARRPMGMTRVISRSNRWIVTNYAAVFILVLEAWSLYDLPLFDFRPYRVGTDIRAGMEIPEDAPMPQFETTFIMEKDGLRREFTLDDYPDSTWTFVDSRTVQTAEGYVPPIHDFSIVRRTDGEDITDSILAAPGYTFLLVAPYLEQADDSRLDLINQVYDYAEDHGYGFFCLTASSDKSVRRWRIMTGAEYEFCTTDGTTLKTIVRSNPGLVLLKDGKVIRKWSHNILPDEYELDGPLDSIGLGYMPEKSATVKTLIVVAWFALPLLLLVLADRMWAWTKWIKRKRRSNKIYQLFKLKDNEKENCSRKLEDEHEPPGGCGSGQGTQRDTDGREA